MVRFWRRRAVITAPQVCACGQTLQTRVVGVAQRAGAEPVHVVSCLHCPRCGDVRG